MVPDEDPLPARLVAFWVQSRSLMLCLVRGLDAVGEPGVVYTEYVTQ
jgi:hypothetical protein